MSSCFQNIRCYAGDVCSLTYSGIKKAKTWSIHSQIGWFTLCSMSTLAGCASFHALYDTLYHSPRVTGLAARLAHFAMHTAIPYLNKKAQERPIPVTWHAWHVTQEALYKNGALTALSGSLIMLITIVLGHALYRMCKKPMRNYEAEFQEMTRLHNATLNALNEKTRLCTEAVQARATSDAALTRMTKLCKESVVYNLYVQLRNKHTQLSRKYTESRASDTTVEVLARFLRVPNIQRALAYERDVNIRAVALEHLISKNLLPQEAPEAVAGSYTIET